MSRLRITLTAALLFVLSLQEGSVAVTLGGTLIQSSATATFSTSSDPASNISSNVVTSTVASHGSLAVSPKEIGCNPQTDLFPAGPALTRLFTIANNSDIADAYTVQTAATTAGSITGIAFVNANGTTTAATLGQTVSQTIQPGQSLQVQLTLATANIAPGMNISITLSAQTTAPAFNGLQTDGGTMCGIAATGPVFGGLQGANSPVMLYVGSQASVQAAPGSTVTYEAAYENYGGIAATNAKLTITLAANVHADPNSVTLNGNAIPALALVTQGALQKAGLRTPAAAAANTQTLNVVLGNVPPGVPQQVQFTAVVDGASPLGMTDVSTATLRADNAATVQSQPASVFVGVANIVYDGALGAGHPLANAQIQIVDPALAAALLKPAGAAILPNAANINPFVTGPDGTYSFGLAASQTGPAGAVVTYTVLITAPGYLNRKIQLDLVADPIGRLYSVTLTAQDGQPLAMAGGFTLTKSSVSLTDVYGVFGNFPLFTTQAVSLSIASDRAVASAGDRVIFTLQFSGSSSTPLGTTSVVDTLPGGLVYAPGTGRLDAAPAEPSVQGGVLTWTVPSLATAHTIVYATAILPTVTAQASLINAATITATFPSAPGTFANARASTTVQVVGGIFTDRTLITGRVFLDNGGIGRFVPGDTGVAAVRIYLEDGESVLTDAFGRFDFPAARPGMHVLRLDTASLPAHVAAYDDKRYDSERSTRRLVHGLFDSGVMQDVNFALRSAP